VKGEKISHYRVLDELGRGGMGIVYAAEDTRLGRIVALKFLPEGRLDAAAKQRFIHEARAASALDHPNICTIHEIDEAPDDRLFIAMARYEGETLKTRLCRNALNCLEALDVAMQVADGLRKAHETGIVHRDIKPANLFLTRDGVVKILDFGLAKLSGLSGITRADATLGTAGYMAPEQIRGAQADQRADLWGLGVVLYEMLAGLPPFRGEQELALMYAVLNEVPLPLRQLASHVPLQLQQIVDRLLAKEPKARYGSAAQVRADLASVAAALRTESSLELSVASEQNQANAPEDPRRVPAPRPGLLESLAVLPFETATRTPDGEYLSDGLTESLINILAELPTLQVTARSTAFRHRGRDPLEVGRSLGVRAVLTGRVFQRDQSLVIGAELIEVATGSQLWGQHYRKRFADIFDIQEQIAREISDKLLPKLTGEQRRQLGRRDTDDLDAYKDYLRGRFHWNRRTLEGMRSAADHFNAAIERDPAYASAYSGLGDTLAMLGIYQGLKPTDAFPKAKAAARRALEIVPESAEALATLGFSTLYFDWDFAEADRMLRTAIELKPQYPSAHQWYGMCLALTQRTDEAIAQWDVARELDPFSASINYTAAWPLYWARRTNEAIARLEEAVSLHPSFWGAHYYLGLAHAQQGDHDNALASLERAQALGDNMWLWEGIGYCYAAAGRTSDARAILDKLERAAPNTYVPPYSCAVIHAGFGDAENALRCLEMAVSDRSWRIAWLGVDPFFDGIRGHPGFPALLERPGQQR
jgi:serine/threonine-protein kinase